MIFAQYLLYFCVRPLKKTLSKHMMSCYLFFYILLHSDNIKVRSACCFVTAAQAPVSSVQRAVFCDRVIYSNVFGLDTAMWHCRLGQLEEVCAFASPASQASVGKFGFTPRSAHYRPLMHHEAAQVIVTMHNYNCPDKATVVIGMPCTSSAEYTPACNTGLQA